MLIFCGSGTWLAAQSPLRLPLVTGYSQGVYAIDAPNGIRWVIDQSTVYRGDERNRFSNWSPLPELYRCGAAFVVEASDKQLTVVAKRQMQHDTSWWMFRSQQSGLMWGDSVPIASAGRFLCGAWGKALFCETDADRPMIVDVYGPLGTKINSIEMLRVRNTLATSLKQCGDSVIAIDRSSGRAVAEVIRGGVGKDSLDWSTAELPEVVYGKVGSGDAFVFQTSNGTFIDHAGSVQPMRVMIDRLDDVAINGRSGTRIANGGIEYSRDVTREGTESFRVQGLLTPSTHRILWSNSGDCHLARQDGTMWYVYGSVDANASIQFQMVQSTEGSVSRGPRLLLSGSTVSCANHFLVTGWDVKHAISSVVQGDVICDTANVSAATPGHEALRRVGTEVWLTTQQGIFAYPDMRRIQQRPGYGAVRYGDQVYMQTTRGIEVRGPADTLSRVLIPDVVGSGMTVSGDSIFVIHIQGVPDSEQDTRIVVDAYDRDGSPYFIGLVVVESAPSRFVTLRSVNRINGVLIINLGRWLVASSDAGITWTEVDPGVELMTAIDDAGQEFVAWARQTNGRSGPAVMIRPDKWVVQPVELRTVAPVVACAHMPGWFVFSTADGAWCVKQSASSAHDHYGNESSETEFFEGMPEQEILVDILGRTFSRETAPRGAYFHAVRFGSQWRTRPLVIIP